MSFWKNVVLMTQLVVFCLFVDRFCQCDSVSTVHDAVTKLYGCVVEIKMKEFKFKKWVWSEHGGQK